VTAVDADVTTSHEAAGLTEKEDSSSPVLVRLGEAAEHILLGPVVTTFGELDEQLLNHGSDNVTRGDGVDSNAILTPLSREVAGELEHSGFTGVVRGTEEALDKQG
jgi:hypothetical protein